MAKEEISIAKLATLLMHEIRKHPECDHVASVAFTRPLRVASHQPNWEPAFSCNGTKVAPRVVFDIATRFQNQYDLI